MNAHFKPTRLSSRLSAGTGGKQVLCSAERNDRKSQ
jgi:hypothetical protein